MGFGERDVVSIGRIKAKAVLLVVYTLYCPHCRKEASKLNELNALLKASPMKDAVRLVGIGAGDGVFDVKTFQKQFKTTYPLAPDPDFSIHRTTGRVPTPFFALVSKDEDALRVHFTHVGGMGEPSAFLDSVLAVAKKLP